MTNPVETADSHKTSFEEALFSFSKLNSQGFFFYFEKEKG